MENDPIKSAAIKQGWRYTMSCTPREYLKGEITVDYKAKYEAVCAELEELLSKDDLLRELYEENKRLKAILFDAQVSAYREGFMISAEGFNGELYQDGWDGVISGFAVEVDLFKQAIQKGDENA